MADKKIPTAVYCRAGDREELAYQVGLASSYIAHCDLEFSGLYIETDDHKEWDKFKTDSDGAQIILLPSVDSVEETTVELDAIAKSLGIVIETVDGSYTSDPAELGVSITNWEEYEQDRQRRKRRREKGKNISKGIEIATAVKGHHRVVPYGYRKAEYGYVIDEYEATYVREMFELAAEGASNAEIAKRMDELEAETRTGIPHWNGDAIRTILSNVMYVGELDIGITRKGADGIVRKPETAPTKYRDNHPAIIDRETFNKVQALLSGRSQKRAESIEASKGEERDVNQYKKIARCKLCDAQLDFIAKTAQNHRKTSVFRCVNHTGSNPTGEPLEKQPLIEFNEMNQKVVDACNDYIYQAATLVRGHDMILEMLGWESENLVAWCKRLGEELLTVREQLLSGEISKTEFLDQVEKLCKKYPDIIEGMNSIDDEWIEAEMIPTTLSAALGSDPLDLYQEELDIEKVKRILDKIWLNPDGTIDIDFKADISPWKERYLAHESG